MIPTVLISWKGRVYRPAGYRVPLADELYVSVTGKLAKCDSANEPQGERLILREYSPTDFRAKE